MRFASHGTVIYMRTKHINNKGFTAVEMAIVMVVLGTLIAIAVPSFSSFMRSHRVAGTSNELIGDMHYARSLAVSKRKTFHIEFTATEYKIVETATAEVIKTNQLPGGLNCVASADPSFYPWGIADPITVTISKGSKVRNLALSANGHVAHY